MTPAQALLVVVPLDSHLEIEAMVSNRDIGFVHADQEAEIKIDTFSFTRYGLLHGRVLNVSQDAITRDKPQDKSNDKAAGAENSTSERIVLASASVITGMMALAFAASAMLKHRTKGSLLMGIGLFAPHAVHLV